MPKIDKDTVTNMRTVAVELLQYEVLQLIEDAALKEAGIEKTPAVTVEVTLTNTTDSAGYERKTEGLAVGARVKITIDKNHTTDMEEPPYWPGERDQNGFPVDKLGHRVVFDQGKWTRHYE